MTLTILVNAAVRMLLFCAVVWLVIRVVQLRNPRAESLVWRMALLASLALPALMVFRVAPSFATQWQLPVLSSKGAGARGVAPLGALPELPSRVLVTIYLGGALLLVARLVIGLVALWRVCRAGD